MTVRRVLVVDDQPDMREMIKVSLQLGRSWDVLTADSGWRALELAAVEHLDAILLDAMMPGMDGPTTFRRLQSDPASRPIPVVLLTAETQIVADRNLAGVIRKPFHPLRLAGQLALLLGWSAE
jgi:CheY-like chemotaxis protein